MNTSEKLKRAIDDRGIRYSFIAKKTGININSLSRSLIGKRRLQADELRMTRRAGAARSYAGYERR